MVCVMSPHPPLTQSSSWKRTGRQLTAKRHKKCKVSVRFDSQKNDVVSYDGSTWLSKNEYTSIRKEVEATIILMNHEPGGDNRILPEMLCSRGLEDFYYLQEKTRLKREVFLRRKQVISSILDEQESMRRRRNNYNAFQCRGYQLQKQEQALSALRSATILQINQQNTLKAIERGLNDAQQANTVYQEWIQCRQNPPSHS